MKYLKTYENINNLTKKDLKKNSYYLIYGDYEKILNILNRLDIHFDIFKKLDYSDVVKIFLIQREDYFSFWPFTRVKNNEEEAKNYIENEGPSFQGEIKEINAGDRRWPYPGKLILDTLFADVEKYNL